VAIIIILVLQRWKSRQRLFAVIQECYRNAGVIAKEYRGECKIELIYPERIIHTYWEPLDGIGLLPLFLCASVPISKTYTKKMSTS